MIAQRRCWWCGRRTEVDTALPEDDGLIRDDSAFDTSIETWICADGKACIRRFEQRS